MENNKAAVAAEQLEADRRAYEGSLHLRAMSNALARIPFRL